MSQTFFPAEHHFDEWLMIKNDFKNQQTSFNFKQLFMVFSVRPLGSENIALKRTLKFCSRPHPLS